MQKIIAIANQKGGVGKTTTCVNLASYLALMGKKVLAVDIDPQGNCSSGFGIDKSKVKYSTYSVLSGEVDVKTAVQPTCVKNLDILPSNIDLAGAEVELVGVEDREKVLKKVLAPVRNVYDYILIDCPPSLGMLNINTLTAADSIIVPTGADYLSVKGLDLIIQSVVKARSGINPGLQIEGILYTMVNGRTNNEKDIIAAVEKTLGERVRIFHTQIPHSVRAKEAVQNGKSIYSFSKSSKVAKAYEELTKEVNHNAQRTRHRSRSDGVR